MGLEQTRAFLLKLPRVEETLQWDSLVFWTGDKTIGGKMFAMLQPEPDSRRPQVVAFAVPPESYHDLLELEGISPAPYLARAHWVTMEAWDTLPQARLHAHLQGALHRVSAALPRKTQRLLEGSDREYRAAVREHRAAAKVAVKKLA